MSRGTKVWIALGTIYVIWGSTYLGIELTGETIPPLFGAAVRFLLAALLMAAIAAGRRGVGVFRVGRAELASCALVGVLLPPRGAVQAAQPDPDHVVHCVRVCAGVSASTAHEMRDCPTSRDRPVPWCSISCTG